MLVSASNLVFSDQTANTDQILLCTLMLISPVALVAVGTQNFCLVHVSLVPVLGVVGEQVSTFVSMGSRNACVMAQRLESVEWCRAHYSSSVNAFAEDKAHPTQR